LITCKIITVANNVVVIVITTGGSSSSIVYVIIIVIVGTSPFTFFHYHIFGNLIRHNINITIGELVVYIFHIVLDTVVLARFVIRYIGICPVAFSCG